MSLAVYIPTLRGWLALGFGLADALIVPLLIPAYDAPKPRRFDWIIASLLAVGTVVTCLRSFRGPNVGNRIAALLTALFAVWMFYVFLRRTA